MKVDAITNTNFTSRFCDRYNRPEHYIIGTLEAQRHANLYTQEDKEFANAIEYLLNDGKDDTYEIKDWEPKRTRNGGIDLYKNGKIVKSFEHYNSSYYNWHVSVPALIRKYVGKNLKVDLSKNTPAGEQWYNYSRVTNYISQYYDRREVITRGKADYKDLRSSAYDIMGILNRLEKHELSEKFGMLSQGARDTRTVMQKELGDITKQLDTISRELNKFDVKKAAKKGQNHVSEDELTPNSTVENLSERKSKWQIRLESIQELKKFLEDNKPLYKKILREETQKKDFYESKSHYMVKELKKYNRCLETLSILEANTIKAMQVAEKKKGIRHLNTSI